MGRTKWFAAHVVPLDVWYVVPVAALAAGTSLRLYPDDGCKAARFEKCREGWDLFRGNGADAPGDRTSGAPMEELQLGDAVVPESIGRFRPPVWKPRFFGR